MSIVAASVMIRPVLLPVNAAGDVGPAPAIATKHFFGAGKDVCTGPPAIEWRDDVPLLLALGAAACCPPPFRLPRPICARKSLPICRGCCRPTAPCTRIPNSASRK
jgi:hypothetical protein